MQLIIKIVQSFILILVLASFVVSTTGFAFSTHNCSHENDHVTVITEPDNCCSAQEAEPIEKPDECCSSSCCEVDNSGEDCCTLDVTYFRLTEYYVQNSIDDQKFDYSPVEQECFIGLLSEKESTGISSIEIFSKEKIPKQKKYLLYNQVKLDPPLV